MALADMQKPKKNSPSTTLTAGITDSANTIPVAELSVFYDADGALITSGIVIGYDSTTETYPEEITITAASGTSGAGNLTGAVRGISADGTNGAARAWNTGIRIAVMLTSTGIETIEDNITTTYTDLGTHVTDATNPHSVTATQVGLGSVEDGAEINIIEAVKVNGSALTPDGSRAVDVLCEPPITQKTAFNKDYTTTATDIKMNGVQSLGTNDTIPRSDHVHPTDSNLQKQIDFLNTLNSPIIGVSWDTTSTSPTLTRIDAEGNTLGAMSTADFDKHICFGGRWRCVRNRTTGAITYGTNARGDGLTLDGTAGDVLVRKPIVYVKADYGVAGTGIARYWISPRPAAGFVVHPAWMQRNNGIASPIIYSGAYESYGYLQ
ncbi:MAG: hypothetical protein PHZ06_11590, partial [Proteiniphilum sp.]|nr:hypothetical protein [Proteiniphilum sp.]